MVAWMPPGGVARAATHGGVQRGSGVSIAAAHCCTRRTGRVEHASADHGVLHRSPVLGAPADDGVGMCLVARAFDRAAWRAGWR